MSESIEFANESPTKEDGPQSIEAVTSVGTHPTPSSKPPDGGYGWVCLFACFCVNAFTWGVVASYGVYLAYYLANNIYPSATSIDFAFIGGLNFSMAMIVAPFVTIFARKAGTQVPMATGAILLAAGYISASFAHEIWQLYLSQGVLVGFGVGLVSIPSMQILPQWFDKRRSLANGISSAGSGIGGLIFSLATQAMIENISLAWSLRITGITCGIMNLFSALMTRNRNLIVKPPQRGFDTKLVRRYEVLLQLAWGFISMLGYIVILFSLSDFARSIGLSASQSSAITAFLNLGTAIGRPMIGVVSDRYGRLETSGIITFVNGMLCFAVWIPANSYGVTILFSILSGAMLGVFWMTVGPISVEVAGLAELPSLLSLTWMSVVLPLTFSEAIALKLRRPNSGHDYLYPQLFAGLAYIVASGCMYELRRFKREQKRRAINPKANQSSANTRTDSIHDV